jgi:plasmid replication initiation protein
MQTLGQPHSAGITSSTPEALAVQHNALVNARFNFDTLEMRLFLAMLGRIRRHDKSFEECLIPIQQLAPPDGVYLPYLEVAAMVKRLARRAIDVELLGPDGRRQKELGITSIPLMSIVSYTKASGQVVARFNDDIRPYLLQLHHNFTKAEISQLQKLKSVSSHRIYWLLKEYASFGRRTIPVAELRNVLKLTTEYVGRFDHFRARILDRAQEELARTDLPFTYEVGRQGREVTEIRFFFAPASVAATTEPQESVVLAWEETLLAVGIAAKSLAAIKAQLAAGIYKEEYITYVVAQIQKQVSAGKVKKKAGAIYKALTEGYLLEDWQQEKVKLAAPKTPKPAASRTRNLAKLAAELEDAQTSLRWLQQKDTFDQYAANTGLHAQHLAAATAKVTALQQALISNQAH